jgi:hypothetical protein
MPSLGDIAGLADDLFNQCAKEYNRRLSGVHHLKDNGEIATTSPAISLKSGKPVTNVSNFMQSPKNKVNKVIEKSSSMNNFGRDRANSAFQQFDANKNEIDEKEESIPEQQQPQKTNNPMKSPLIKGNQGEPSFGAGSKQESISNARNS